MIKADTLSLLLLTLDVHSALCLLGSILVDDLANVKPCVRPLS